MEGIEILNRRRVPHLNSMTSKNMDLGMLECMCPILSTGLCPNALGQDECTMDDHDTCSEYLKQIFRIN